MNLGRTTVDFVMNFLARMVFEHSIIAFVSTKIATIAIYNGFFTIQKLRRYCDIVNISRRNFDGMNQTAILINANVRLVAEMPSVPFLHLMRLRVALVLLILGRGRRGDQRRINNCAFLQ